MPVEEQLMPVEEQLMRAWMLEGQLRAVDALESSSHLAAKMRARSWKISSVAVEAHPIVGNKAALKNFRDQKRLLERRAASRSRKRLVNLLAED